MYTLSFIGAQTLATIHSSVVKNIRHEIGNDPSRRYYKLHSTICNADAIRKQFGRTGWVLSEEVISVCEFSLCSPPWKIYTSNIWFSSYRFINLYTKVVYVRNMIKTF